MRLSVLAPLFAVGCVTTSQLAAPRADVWPQGWQACSAVETEQQLNEPRLTAEQACGLGVDGCRALQKTVTACGRMEPARLVVLASTDAEGKVTTRCVAAATGPIVQETLACLDRALGAITAAPDRLQVPVYLRLDEQPWVTDGIGLTQEGVMRTIKTQVPRMSACRDEHHRSGSRGGKLVLKFGVAADGTVGPIETISREFEGTPVYACMSQVFSAMKFPVHTVASEEPIIFPIML